MFGKFRLYALIHSSHPNNFLTIVSSKNEAREYAQLYIKLKHLDHFIAWSEARDLNPDDIEVWNSYFEKCIQPEEKDEYRVVKIYYEKSNLLAMLRMFCNCAPLGCSFDTNVEYEYVKHKANQLKKLEEEIIKKMKEFDKSQEYDVHDSSSDIVQ